MENKWTQEDKLVENQEYISMEVCSHGDLFDLISKNGCIKDKALLMSLFKQVGRGVAAIHQTGNAHLDLKLENILIDSELNLKICDFGFVQPINELLTVGYGSENYMAPEIRRKDQYRGGQADIFSLGVILFILSFGVPPFVKADMSDRLF